MKSGLQLGLHPGLELVADAQHPNKMKFRGTLVRLDEPSTKPPGGAQGHRILVPADVARKRLGTLKGMGVNYSPDLDGHAQRRKVGVIDRAWIEGKDLKVAGYIWKHDFPEAEQDLKQPGLGMSMELGQVSVENPRSSIWTLTDFNFLGATILWRENAAYYRTQAIAAKAEQRRGTMPKTIVKKTAVKKTSEERIAAIAAQAAAGVLKGVVEASNKLLLGQLSRQTKILGGIAAQQELLAAHLDIDAEDDDVEISADDADVTDMQTKRRKMKAKKVKAKNAADEDDGDGEDDGEDDVDSESHDMGHGGASFEHHKKHMKAKKAAADDEDEEDPEDEDGGEEEVDAADKDDDIDVGDLEETDEAEDEEEPGHSNEDAENQGDKTTSDDKIGPTVKAQLQAMRVRLRKMDRKLRVAAQTNHSLTGKLRRYQKQVTAAAEQTARRSLSPELTVMLQKSNIDPNDVFRTHTKFNVPEVDGIIANWATTTGLTLKPEDRMALKNKFLHAGMMEDGYVERSLAR